MKHSNKSRVDMKVEIKTQDSGRLANRLGTAEIIKAVGIAIALVVAALNIPDSLEQVRLMVDQK